MNGEGGARDDARALPFLSPFYFPPPTKKRPTSRPEVNNHTRPLRLASRRATIALGQLCGAESSDKLVRVYSSLLAS